MYKKSEIEIKDLKGRSSKMSKEEKIEMLSGYAKECYRKGHKPTKKEIRNKFHLEIYNYFKNIADYHNKAEIEVSLRNCSKEEARRLIIEFVQNKSEDKIYPNRKEIEKALGIKLSTYFKNLRDLYENVNISYSLVENAINKKVLSSHTYNNSELEKQKQLIRDFIKTRVVKGFYPSVQHIQKSLNLSFYNLYNNIFEAYKDAEVEYERPSPILLGKKKEEVFTKIVKELLIKTGFKITRVSIESETDFNRHSDMTVEDKNGIKYLIEIKAYRRDYSIERREFQQLLDYLKKENLPNGIFITTSNTKKCNFGNIQFINGKTLKELLKIHGLGHYIKQIQWIQQSRVNSKERERYRVVMKKKIFDYIRLKTNIPTKKEIQKKFGIDLRTIFGEIRPYEKLLNDVEKLGALTPAT